jgi:hypothetical protein
MKAVESIETKRAMRDIAATQHTRRDTPKMLFTVMDQEMGFADRDID